MTRDEALALLFARHDGREVTEEEVRLAHRTAAQVYHPDVGGSEAEMARVNEARDVLLAKLKPDEARCVCRGFERNPLCEAHERVVAPVEERKDGGLEACVCRGLLRNPLCKAH